MADILVRYQYDPTGRNPDNLVQGELHSLTPVTGFPYKIITMNHGGFYAKGARVYDASYNRLIEGEDYILTYNYAHQSTMLGLKIVNDIVFLNKARVGNVYVSAQVVGGDQAFSLTGIQDYVAWYKTQPTNYVPQMYDYDGNEPEWLPGELDKERWRLDTYEPFNNEIYQIARSAQGGRGIGEEKFRSDVQTEYQKFLDKFNSRLQDHIDNKNNPHTDVKSDIGLGMLQNLKLATDAESRAGTSNALYQTPLLSWATLDALAVTPLNNHIANFNNPHKTTAAKIDAPSKSVVDTTVNGKYTDTETVANSNALLNGSTPISYTQFYNNCRTNIPATNFIAGGGNGYLNPYRLGGGIPGPGAVLRSGANPQWVQFDALLVENNIAAAPGCLTLDFASSVTPAQAFAEAMAQPFASSAINGSIICYSLYSTLEWGAGNGIYTTRNWVTNVLYKTPSGWVQV